MSRLLSGTPPAWQVGIAQFCGGLLAAVGCSLLAYWGTRRTWPGLLLPLVVVMVSLLGAGALLGESPRLPSLPLLFFYAPTVLGALVGFVVILLASVGIRRTRTS